MVAKRRPQFVRGAGGERAEGDDALVAQGLFAGRGQVGRSRRRMRRRHARHEPGDHGAETTKVSHMPPRCRRVARSASAQRQRYVNPISGG